MTWPVLSGRTSAACEHRSLEWGAPLPHVRASPHLLSSPSIKQSPHTGPFCVHPAACSPTQSSAATSCRHPLPSQNPGALVNRKLMLSLLPLRQLPPPARCSAEPSHLPSSTSSPGCQSQPSLLCQTGHILSHLRFLTQLLPTSSSAVPSERPCPLPVCLRSLSSTSICSFL